MVMYCDTIFAKTALRFALTSKSALTALRLFWRRRFALFGTCPINSCVKWLLVLYAMLATFAVAEEEATAEQDVYIAPIDISIQTARLIPQYTLREEIYGVQNLHDELIGRDRYAGMFDDLEFKQTATNADITVFWLLQALDVYTTLEATQYRCVTEANPLLPKKPTFEQLVLLKMIPHIFWDPQDLYTHEIESLNAITGLVVANNTYVISKAKKICP